ncbi:homeodomain-like domain-containing protein [Ditylenchus destructor]|uniref:Homeodomain-like domain-containing protein n=1 Tax=Ditylenchus destructor TaxID=166010 RepID=A0AAD4QY08_9BILA|nr:homeodomain-like domain-containing protein [Ditylenchus destructor]
MMEQSTDQMLSDFWVQLNPGRSMQRKLTCSKCGQCDFATLDDLETHIVKMHFNDVDAFYECLYPRCLVQFPTEFACLKHELHAHLSGDLASLTLKQMQKRFFVTLRLEIQDCLNESINLSFLRLTGSNGNNIQRNEGLETTAHQAVKDDLSLFDELAETVPASSNHSQKLIPNKSTNHQTLSSPINNLDSINESIEAVVAKLDGQTANNSVRHTTKKIAKPQISSGPANNPDSINESIEAALKSVARSTTATSSRKTRLENSGMNDARNKMNEREISLVIAAPATSNDGSGKNNEMIEPVTSSSPSMVKDEPSLMDELAADIPVSSNSSHNVYLGSNESAAPSPIPKRSRKQNFPDLYAEVNKSTQPQTSSNPPVVKEEPSLIDELAADIPGPSNHRISPSNNESAAASPKRSKMQNFSDLYAEDIKSTQPQTSSNPPVVKEEPSLIDELAESIPGPSNHRISPSNNVINMDSNDEVRIMTAPQGTVKRKSCGGPKKKITPEIELFIVDSCKNNVCQSVLETVIAVKKKFGVQICRRTVINVRYKTELPSSNPKRSRKQNVYDVDGADDRDLSLMEEDDVKILEDILPEERKKPNLTTPTVRHAIIKASSEGLSHQQIANAFNISKATVSKIMSRWMTEGTVARRRICSEAIEQFIVNLVKEDPFKSPTDVIAEVFKKFNQSISYRTASTILKRHNSFKVIFQKDLSQSS